MLPATRSILSVHCDDRITNIVSTFHSKLYTRRFKVSRGDLVRQGQTGEVEVQKDL